MSDDKQPSQIRPLTRQLIECAHLDVWPGHAAVVDFGIDSDRHLGALQFAIRNDLVTPTELDAAMGKGAMLTEIAGRGDSPYRDVTFRTSWDGLLVEPESPPESVPEGRTYADELTSMLHDIASPPDFEEMRLDYEAARRRDAGAETEHAPEVAHLGRDEIRDIVAGVGESGNKYEDYLKEAADRGLSRMDGKDGGRTR
jgi:hypothetical protein